MNATHVHTRPKLVIPEMLASWPVVMLLAAYIPSGKTVAQRRTS